MVFCFRGSGTQVGVMLIPPGEGERLWTRSRNYSSVRTKAGKEGRATAEPLESTQNLALPVQAVSVTSWEEGAPSAASLLVPRPPCPRGHTGPCTLQQEARPLAVISVYAL